MDGFAFFLHLASSGVGHPVTEGFIKRSNSGCLQHGIGGLMVFIVKYPVVRIAAIKKGWKIVLFPGDHIFSH